MTGNIFAPRVGIADGAHFSGRIDMNHKGVAGEHSTSRSPSRRRNVCWRRADRLRPELFDDLRGKRAQGSCAPSAALFDSNTSASFGSGYNSTARRESIGSARELQAPPARRVRYDPVQRHRIAPVRRVPGRLVRQLHRRVAFHQLPRRIAQQVVRAVAQRDRSARRSCAVESRQRFVPPSSTPSPVVWRSAAYRCPCAAAFRFRASRVVSKRLAVDLLEDHPEQHAGHVRLRRIVCPARGAAQPGAAGAGIHPRCSVSMTCMRVAASGSPGTAAPA